MTRYGREVMLAVVVAGITAVTANALVPRVGPPPKDKSGSLYFASCHEARQAGEAPIYPGEPGFRPGLDGDSDGIACEPSITR